MSGVRSDTYLGQERCEASGVKLTAKNNRIWLRSVQSTVNPYVGCYFQFPDNQSDQCLSDFA